MEIIITGAKPTYLPAFPMQVKCAECRSYIEIQEVDFTQDYPIERDENNRRNIFVKSSETMEGGKYLSCPICSDSMGLYVLPKRRRIYKNFFEWVKNWKL